MESYVINVPTIDNYKWGFMFMRDYQKQVQRTMNKDLPFKDRLLNCALGSLSELGEVGDIIKKSVFQGHELNKAELKEELGDVLWYINNLANTLDIDIEEVERNNIQKLLKRYPNGFKSSDSVNRR